MLTLPLTRHPQDQCNPPGDIFDPLETSVWFKNQIRKFPSFMSRRKKKKKDPVCSEGLCQEAELFFLNRW